MATDPPGDLQLAPLRGAARSLDDWLTTFHLAAVVLDPYTYESAWLLETAGRILEHFRGADCRIAFVVTADADDAREFLGPWAERVLTFADPDRELVKALGLNELPRSCTCATTARWRRWPRAGTRWPGGRRRTSWPPP